MKYLMTSGKQIFYSGDEIQEREYYVVIGVCILYQKDKKVFLCLTSSIMQILT